MYLIFYIITLILGILVIPYDFVVKVIFSFVLTNAFFGSLMAIIQPKSIDEFNKYYEIETLIIISDLVLMIVIPFVCLNRSLDTVVVN